MSATLPGVEPTVDLLFAMVGREAAALRDNHFTLHDVLNCITPHNAAPSVRAAAAGCGSSFLTPQTCLQQKINIGRDRDEEIEQHLRRLKTTQHFVILATLLPNEAPTLFTGQHGPSRKESNAESHLATARQTASLLAAKPMIGSLDTSAAHRSRKRRVGKGEKGEKKGTSTKAMCVNRADSTARKGKLVALHKCLLLCSAASCLLDPENKGEKLVNPSTITASITFTSAAATCFVRSRNDDRGQSGKSMLLLLESQNVLEPNIIQLQLGIVPTPSRCLFEQMKFPLHQTLFGLVKAQWRQSRLAVNERPSCHIRATNHTFHIVDRLEDHLLPLVDGGPRMPILGRAIAPSDSDQKHYRNSQRSLASRGQRDCRRLPVAEC
ncbi:uncharacterized protein UDID_18217 [Ustilago sp. UG-2017a]|nr:uncharacterized protein UDID_18217 [Ustilago sp. UG-2017a]